MPNLNFAVQPLQSDVIDALLKGSTKHYCFEGDAVIISKLTERANK